MGEFDGGELKRKDRDVEMTNYARNGREMEDQATGVSGKKAEPSDLAQSGGDESRGEEVIT